MKSEQTITIMEANASRYLIFLPPGLKLIAARIRLACDKRRSIGLSLLDKCKIKEWHFLGAGFQRHELLLSTSSVLPQNLPHKLLRTATEEFRF